jgi:hypothetical protein
MELTERMKRKEIKIKRKRMYSMRKRKERGGDMDDWISTNHAQKHLNINFLFSFFSTVNNKLKLKRIFCRVTLIWPIHAVHANL